MSLVRTGKLIQCAVLHMGAIVGGAEMNMAGRYDRAVFPSSSSSSFIILYYVELLIYIIHCIIVSAINV
jgi:hypothetical protein